MEKSKNHPLLKKDGTDTSGAKKSRDRAAFSNADAARRTNVQDTQNNAKKPDPTDPFAAVRHKDQDQPQTVTPDGTDPLSAVRRPDRTNANNTARQARTNPLENARSSARPGSSEKAKTQNPLERVARKN